jgi:ELWxxDGT repeat protein
VAVTDHYPAYVTRLWKSDGTDAGTTLVKVIENDEIADQYPPGPANPMLDVNGTLFFATALRLWKSDGTEAGTVPVSPAVFAPRSLTNVNGTVFFVASDIGTARELWKSDGTAQGTLLVKDINPGLGSGVSSLEPMVVIGGQLFFVADDGANGPELWKSDGTAAGTVLVRDIAPPGGSIPGELTNVNGTLFFLAGDSASGFELWKSDGTSAGTTLVKDIKPGPGHAFVRYYVERHRLARAGGTLFLAADDGVHGYELWKSDGTAAGTVMVKDIDPTISNGVPGSSLFFGSSFADVAGTLFFAASDAVHGAELWRSDGTTSGTLLVRDVNPDGSLGVADAAVVEGNSGSRTLAFTVTLSSATQSAVTVDYATADGTAKAGEDYVAASGTLTFDPGVLTRTVAVEIQGDATRELAETFSLNLTNAAGGPVHDAQAVGTILNDDGGRGMGDLGGEGGTDIVWRKVGPGVDKGAVFLWTMSGTGLTGARYLDAISEDWQVQFTGDFNGDGKADILWRNVNADSPDAGRLYVWMMDGPNVIGGTGYAAMDADLSWLLDGVGDLNGDGRSDILWRRADAGAAIFVWMMEGTAVTRARYQNGNDDWRVVDFGDFNGDGKADILWRNMNAAAADAAKLVLWMMDGMQATAVGYTAAQADFGWRIDGVGDLNGDGRDDIVWRKTGAGVDKGALFLWLMDGTGLIGARYLDPITEDWQVQGLGDFNGDGKMDILWRNLGPGGDTGKLYIWMMDGPNVMGGTGYTASQADLGWRVDSPRK